MSATASSPRRVASDRARTPGRRTASRPPRRVSGPSGGRLRTPLTPNGGAIARSAAVARAAALPRESVALGERALALVRGLPDHSLIDRLVRGRAWIPVLGVLLAGIVAMQVEILKLGSGIGRSVERGALLQTENESLRASVAGLADDQRIERLAVGMGMSMPSPDSLVFLHAHPGGGVSWAVSNIHAPDPTGFMSQLAAQAAAAAALMPAAPASTATSGTATTAGSSTAPIVATPASAAPAVTSASSLAGAGTAGAGTSATTAPAAPAPVAAVPGQAASSIGVSGASPSSSASGTAGAAAIAPSAGSQSGASTGG